MEEMKKEETTTTTTTAEAPKAAEATPKAEPAAEAPEAGKPEEPKKEEAKKPMNKWLKRGLWAAGAVICCGLAVWGGCALCAKKETETSSDNNGDSSTTSES